MRRNSPIGPSAEAGASVPPAAVKDAPLWLVLIGHGTYDGRVARFNLRGADVTEKDMAYMAGPAAPATDVRQHSFGQRPFP